jgi:transcriptional regulator GlxA family with amidase domain
MKPLSCAPTRHVVLLVYDGFNLLDLSGPLQTFATANRLACGGPGEPPYRLTVASAGGGPIASGADIAVATEPVEALDEASIDTLLVAGGCRRDEFDHPVALEHWIARHAPRARRVCSVCTGAFVLAGAGLLRGRRIATHWAWAQRLQAAYPSLTVDPAPLFVRDGTICTSAGVTAGIDLCLALLEEDLGHEAAMAVAAYMVVFLRRGGGQSQFSEPLRAQRRTGDFASLHAWMAAHLAERIPVETLAQRANMSVRSFARAYRDKVGCTPARMLETLRVEAACRLLAAGDRSLKSVATQCGFRDAQSLRRVLLRRLGVPPAAITEAGPWLARLRDDGAAQAQAEPACARG